MSHASIREADWNLDADCRAVVDLINAYAQEPVEGGRPLPIEVQERLAGGLAALPTAFALLAFVDERPVGVAVCLRGFSTFAGKPLINVHDLAVLTDFRGRGIGTELLEAVTQRARTSGCCKVTLEVRSSNTSARRLYERLGFSDAGGQPTQFLERRL